jgi:cysteine desulfurase
VDFVDPDSLGVIQPESVKSLLRKETVFVSVGWANGEIGVIQPLARIKEVLRAHEEAYQTVVLLHSDAGQAPLYDGAHVHSLGVDMLTLDSGKLYGPRGVGALYLNNRVQLSSIQLGGSQERGLRAGTENVALTVGFAASFAAVASERVEESKRLSVLREKLEKGLTSGIAGVIINGDVKRMLPHMLNISIPGIDSEYLTLSLDNQGIAVSTKSACREGEHQKSHVVTLLGGDEWRARNTIRFSLGCDTREADIDRVVHALVQFCTTHTE